MNQDQLDRIKPQIMIYRDKLDARLLQLIKVRPREMLELWQQAEGLVRAATIADGDPSRKEIGETLTWSLGRLRKAGKVDYQKGVGWMQKEK